MKNFFVLAMLAIISMNSFAQDDDEEVKGGFKQENLFTGGGLNLAFSSGATAIGIDPLIGYSINRFVDAGFHLGFNYVALRDPNYNIRQHSLGLSPGVFTRIYPIKFLFTHVQFERNFIRDKIFYDNDNITKTYSRGVNSLLVGGGYCSGREGVGGGAFFYLSVLFDVLGDVNSPYVDEYHRIIPIIKAGVQLPLNQGRRGGY